MLKRILFALLILCAFSPCFAFETWQVTATCTVATDNTFTDNVSLPQFGVGPVSYVYVPTITSSTVSLHASMDGTNFGAVGNYDNTTNMVDWGTAAGTGLKMYLLPDLRPFRKVHFHFGSQQAANRSLVIFGVK